MEEANRNKKYRVSSVYYEFSGREIKVDYSDSDILKISGVINKWSDCDFDIYFDDLERELVPPELTIADRKRFIEYLKKGIGIVNN